MAVVPSTPPGQMSPSVHFGYENSHFGSSPLIGQMIRLSFTGKHQTWRLKMKDERAFVLEKIQHTFPDLDAQALLKQFEVLGNPEIYRVALAILKLCQEDGKDSPDDFIEAAAKDYRDVLMWAEYPNGMQVASWKDPAEKIKAATKADRKQYLDWLNDKQA
jgi:hypothetical protein